MTGQVEIAGRYQRRGTLGTGAGTVVYEAFDQLIERRVAVKVVTLPPVDDPETAEAIARFRRGARAAGGLGHPNIVAVFDYGENAEEAWIVMELVDGGSLKNLLDRGERLAVGRIVQIMTQLLEGLGYSHAKGVVHRDIKPANIMLTPGGVVKIADFGIARLENSSMTHVGTMIGTPAYMAPEQLRGEVVDLRADIWAAGVVLYQLLTGEKPFGGGITSIMQKALYTEPVPPSRMRPQAGLAADVATGMAGFDAVVARAMAKLPVDRFASAADFAAALRQAAAGPGPAMAEAARSPATAGQRPVALDDGTVVHPRPPRRQVAKPRSRLPILAGVAAILVLAVVGGLLLTPAPRPDPGRLAEAASPAPPAPPAMPQAPPPQLAAPPLAPSPVAPPPAAPQPAPAPPQAAELQPAPPPPVAPRPAAPAAVPPAEPDFATVAAVLRALPCSLLQVGQSGRRLAVSGLALATEAEAMQRSIAAHGIPPAAVRLSVDSFTAPYCETLGLLRPVAALGDDAPGFAFTGPNPLRGGQPLRFTIATPAWAARLHVAYVTATGEVGHLVQGGAPFFAGTTVPFGEAGRWVATAPFGIDMLVIIASEAPLFPQRRRGERLEEFNIALNGALRDAQAAGRVAARAVLVHTVAGP